MRRGWNDPSHHSDCCCEDCRSYREPEKVDEWRLQVLLEAGYEVPWAELIAISEADLHEAVELVTVKGCPPATAAKIIL